ncbi:prepilin-type N-terminal cleavage/methylation domain-containing protein [Candidatus Parcubacteria bacterium]|nr:prepilin-type N-terminal cleavage/methylation domain-containing protein [Candidatus Parcubacteria bacterium]
MLKLPKHQKGFTIVEVLISSLIFSIITISVSSIFVQVLSGQRRAFAVQKIQENGLFVMELMSREIRVSKIVNQDSTNCTATTLTLIHPVNGTVVYNFTGVTLQRSVNGANANISSQDVQFTRFNFCVTGSLPTDLKQPRVTILSTIENITTNPNNKFSINLETTVSSRDVQSEFEQ